MRKARYAGFEREALGKKFAAGEASLDELADAARQLGAGEEKYPPSGKHEKYESIFNAFAFGAD